MSAEVVQALIKGMLATKQNREDLNEIKLFQDMSKKNVMALLDFSARLLMPWIGMCCAHKAAQESGDVELLLEIISRNAAALQDAQEERHWQKVVDLARCSALNKIAKALQRADSACMGEAWIQQLVTSIQPGPWIKEEVSIQLVARQRQKPQKRSFKRSRTLFYCNKNE